MKQIILAIFSFLIPVTHYLALPRRYLPDETGEYEVDVDGYDFVWNTGKGKGKGRPRTGH